MGNNIIDFLCEYKNSDKKFVWCIRSIPKEQVTEDTTNSDIKKITLFTCAVNDILSNEKIKKILNQVKVVSYEDEGNDLFVFVDYKNHQLIRSQLKSQGIN